MADLNVYLVSTIQIVSDVVCVLVSAKVARENKQRKIFFLTNSLAFTFLTFADIYYNYMFRIMNADILISARLINNLPLAIFQFIQLYNWYFLLKEQKAKIFSWLNLPYLLFSATAIFILVFFFITTDDLPIGATTQRAFSVTLDMFVWLFAIICLGRAKSNSLALLALGCLMIVSSDLTTTCLFMFEMNNVAIAVWPHIVWTVGTFLMAIGFIKSSREENFTFYSPSSIHAKCCWWLLISSLIAFKIGFIFPFLFNSSKVTYEIHYALWNVPIALMFTMTAATLLSNRFSKIILSPINAFIYSIESFNAGNRSEITIHTDIYEFKVLGNFLEASFIRISEQLDREIKIAAQVAHDIRSPLSALEIGIRSLPALFDESKRVLLRDAVQHIQDITNNLEKNDDIENKSSKQKVPTQIAVLVDNIVSERRLALCRQNMTINQLYESESYRYFSDIVPSMLKRILTNIINNAYEAISDKNGIINIDISEEKEFCIIKIADNGNGIPSTNIKFLFTRGFSTKANGSGLGLYHAKETLIEWGGDIEIISTTHKGTEVYIKIPFVSPPLWFISSLSLLANEPVVCVDDNISIWQSWQERFKAFGFKQNLIYCSSKENFIKEFKHLKYKRATYLVDFEFSGKSYNGYEIINLILMLNNNNRIFMVTSRSGEKDIQDYCIRHAIKIIPKNFAVKIPLRVFDTNKSFVALTKLGINEAHFLDKSKWHIYQTASDLLSDLAYINNDTQIYIQEHVRSNLIDTMLNKYGLNATLFLDINDLKNK